MTWTICSEISYAHSVNAGKDFFKVHEVDVQLPLPFGALLSNVAKGEYMTYASSSFSETCLFLSKSVVHKF